MVTESAANETCRIWDASAARGTTAAVHQPNYIPWLGYFFKIAHSDKFVFLDNAAYSCGSFVNRNSIKAPNGPAWLTIPVLKSGRFGQLISEVETSNSEPWTRRHLATLQSNYGRAPYFKEIFGFLEPYYRAATDARKSLSDFNIQMICSIATYLHVNTQFMRASELNVLGHKTELLINICRVVGATTYLAGTGGKSYQEDDKFEKVGITPLFSSFSPRSYPQLFGGFVGNLSIVDVLMNCGYLGTRRLLGVESEQAEGTVSHSANV